MTWIVVKLLLKTVGLAVVIVLIGSWIGHKFHQMNAVGGKDHDFGTKP